MKKERKLSLKVISLFAALIGALSVTGVALASPPKTATNSQENSQGSQSQPKSNSSESNTNNNSSNAPENKNNNSDTKENSPLKDNPSKADVKELKWDESRHCYVAK